MKKSSKSKKKKIVYIPTVGRRKTATARIRLFTKKGKIVVNNIPIEEYFPGKTSQLLYEEPFRITNTLGKYSASIKVKGSGKKAQLGAVIHGFARALVLLNKDFRPLLKKRGFLTRDPRKKERRKAGLAHKARAKKISPKR